MFLGWYRGFSTKNRGVKGIFPSSYVHLKPCKIDNEGLFESVIPLEDPVVREVTLVLREWGGIWKRLYVVSILYYIPYFFYLAFNDKHLWLCALTKGTEYSLVRLKTRPIKKNLWCFFHTYSSVHTLVYSFVTKFINYLLYILCRF